MTNEPGNESLHQLPSVDQLTVAYNEVLAYNERHTGNGLTFRDMMKALIDRERYADNPGQARSVEENITETKTTGDMHGELQQLLHGDLFTRVGVKMAPLGRHAAMTGDGGETTSSALVPVVENTELFTDYLSTLSPNVADDPDKLKLTSDVIKNLRYVVDTGMTASNAGGELAEQSQEIAEDALRVFLAIDPRFKRLGLNNPVAYQRTLAEDKPQFLNKQWRRYKDAEEYEANYAALERYVEYWRRGVLPEYIKMGPTEELAKGQLHYFDGGQEKLSQDVDAAIPQMAGHWQVR